MKNCFLKKNQLKGVFALILPLLFLIPSIYFQYSAINPFQRGFFCNDENLKYPYKEKAIIPPFVCLLIWISLSCSIFLMKREHFFTEIYHFFLGLSICILLTNILKYSLGGLRPYFLTVCNPNWNEICFDGDAYYLEIEDNVTYFTHKEYYRKFVYDANLVCDNMELIKEARLSSVSGHASTSFYSAFFIIHFLELKFEKTYFLRFLLQLGTFILSTLISITRILDFKHHTSDVFWGLLLGVCTAMIIRHNQNKIFDQTVMGQLYKAPSKDNASVGDNPLN